MESSGKFLVLITATNPKSNFIDYVAKIANSGFDVLVVNDGSKREYVNVFNRLEVISNCTVFTNAKNFGKGRAIKNAFNYLLTNLNYNNYDGVITVEQILNYNIEDIKKIAYEIEKYPKSLVLAYRNKNRTELQKNKDVEKISKVLLKFLYSEKITDINSGLRGYPKQLIFRILDIKGEKDDYHLHTLVYCFENNIRVREIEIESRSNVDRIYSNLIARNIRNVKIITENLRKYVATSLSVFIIEIILFSMLLTIFSFLGISNVFVLIFLCGLVAKSFVAVLNYVLKQFYVFKGVKANKKLNYKYAITYIVLLLLSTTFIYIFVNYLSLGIILSKFIVDFILFFGNYLTQKRWVFSNLKNDK